ncbi:hypothetical protein COM90_19245 [Bacillus thuringiensis]|uniref:Uncharacterized protein n=2 Tax=Bacillus thuringiensis TaxID=1428 RepID=A0AB36TKN6_BACTU|nr:hypothetical protein A9L49_30725 [Bacillus cereus]PEE62163.1 hypothetical protein COM74_25730 [Bacillus thuringiensis]PEE87180.1 hypothetical protein COM90_19245 [Bacillus thuringiensis]PER52595.1 hypothetical protein CN486_24780 [Bacillus thuringiensis]PEV62830.1 hypothetical protein CN434_28645 [Bacillus thuringiensis]
MKIQMSKYNMTKKRENYLSKDIEWRRTVSYGSVVIFENIDEKKILRLVVKELNNYKVIVR